MKLIPSTYKVNELTTQITAEISEMFPEITHSRTRNTRIINDLAKKLAIALATIEVYENLNK